MSNFLLTVKLKMKCIAYVLNCEAAQFIVTLHISILRETVFFCVVASLLEPINLYLNADEFFFSVLFSTKLWPTTPHLTNSFIQCVHRVIS